MSMTINTNIDALNALRNLTTTGTAFSSSVQKLSSGLRINTAADDAAGLSIATKLQSQVTGLNQAQRNAQDGVSMVQTAEGALNQVQTMLQRIRELAVEAGNSTLSSSDAASVQSEITALEAEINRTATSTTFNGQALLTGNLSTTRSGGTLATTYTAGGGGNTSNLAITNVDVKGADAGQTYTLTANGASVTLTEGAGNGARSQTVAVSIAGGVGSQVLNFNSLGVSVAVTAGT